MKEVSTRENFDEIHSHPSLLSFTQQIDEICVEKQKPLSVE